MANIELVIKIAEEAYQGIVNANKAHGQWGNDLLGILCEGIANGTQLPKGHGDLIDRNELKKVYDEQITYLYTLNRKDNPSRETKICATNWCSNTIDELPTIIEADIRKRGIKYGNYSITR